MTIQVTIPPELERFVEEQIVAGNFASVEELVQVALEDLRKAEEQKLARLRAELQKGIDDLEAGRFIDLNTDADVRAFFASLGEA